MLSALNRFTCPVCVGLLLACLASASALAKDVEVKPTYRLWIVIGIEGQDVRLAVDMCAEQTVLLRSEAERLKLKIEGPPADTVAGPGETIVSTALDVHVQLGEQQVVTNIAVVEDPPYSDIVGAVGWSWLKQTRFVINWDAQQIQFLGGDDDLGQGLEGFTAFGLSDQVPLAAISLGGEKDGLVYLDTGSFAGVAVSDARWASFRKQHPQAPKTLQAQYDASAGVIATEIMWADRYDLGKLTLRATTLESCTRGHAALPGFQAILGISAMFNLHWVVDGPGGQVLIRPVPEIRTPFDYNRAGAVFLPKGPGDDTLVARVVEGGPAYVAGVRDGDALLAIGDLDVTRWRTDPKVLPLSRFWWQPAGNRLELKLRSGGRSKLAAVTLRDLFPRADP